MRTPLGFLLLICLVLLSGCVLRNDKAGVRNRWREPGVPTFEIGVSDQSDVLEALGPPSQLIRLEKGSVFYYLREETDLRTIILLVVNWTDSETRYDRAIFFFDEGGVLTEFATSPEALPTEKD